MSWTAETRMSSVVFLCIVVVEKDETTVIWCTYLYIYISESILAYILETFEFHHFQIFHIHLLQAPFPLNTTSKMVRFHQELVRSELLGDHPQGMIVFSITVSYGNICNKTSSN